MVQTSSSRQVAITTISMGLSTILYVAMFLSGAFFVSAAEPDSALTQVTLIASSTISAETPLIAEPVLQTEAEIRANRLSAILLNLEGVAFNHLTTTEAKLLKKKSSAEKEKVLQAVAPQIKALKEKKRNAKQASGDVKKAALEEFQTLSEINASIDAAATDDTLLEPSYLMTLQDIYIPNDPRLNEQWYISRIMETTSDLWFASNTTPNPPIIAVIDAGVDFTHEDLNQTKWQSTTCANERGEQIGTCTGGYDFVDNDNDPRPSDNATHGTAVASLIAASTDNEVGIASLSRGHAQIMSLRVAENGVLETDDIVRAILFAVHNGAKMINMSFSGPTYSRQLEEAILYAEDHGVVMVVAAGNAGINLNKTPVYPASFKSPYIVTVGALDENGMVTSWSNYGKAVDVFAPGASILAASSNNSYSVMYGTSFSAPIITSYLTTKIEQGVTLNAALKALPKLTSYKKLSASGSVLGTGRAPLGRQQPIDEILIAPQKDASGKWFDPQSKAGEYIINPKKFTSQAINSSLGLPQMLAPGNVTQPGPSVATTGSIKFSWTSVSGAASYGVYIRDLTTNTLIVDCAKCTTATSKSFTGFIPGRQYRWNMNSWDSSGNNSSAYTTPFHFVVPIILAAPSGLTPGSTSATGPEYTGTSKTLAWSAVPGAAGYYLEFTNTSTGVVKNYTLTGTSKSVSTTAGDNFKWRVRTKNSAGQYGSYSAYYYFKIKEANTAPYVPAISGSGAGSINNGYTIGFASYDTQGDQIKFEVKWNANSSSAVSTYGYYASGVTSGNASNVYTTADTYCIQIRAIDTQGSASAYSPCHNVTVASAAVTPTLTVTPVSQTVAQGSNATFSISTSNVASCKLTGNGVTNSPLSAVNGTYSVGPHSVSTSYDVTCTGNNGTIVSRNFYVNIGTVASTLTFTTIPNVSNGNAFTLGFTTTGIPTGSVITLVPSIGNITPSTITLSGTSYSGSTVIKSATGGVTLAAKYNGTTVGTSNSFTVSNGTICSASLSSLPKSTIITGSAISTASSSAHLSADDTQGVGDFAQSGLCAPENPSLPEPYLISPGTPSSPGTQFSTTSIVFQITPVTGAASYELYLRNISNSALYTIPITSTAVRINNIPANSQWRWNAAAKGSDGRFGWVTDVNYFTTGVVSSASPSFTLSPSTQTIASGGTASFALTTTNVSSCTISGGGYTNATWGAMVNGTLNVNNITASATYTFNCLGSNGTTLTLSANVVVSATAPKVSFNTIGSQVTGTVFPITITTTNVPSGAVIDLTSSAGLLHTKTTTQYPITYLKNVTLSGTTYTGSINITSAATGARTVTARYNGAIVGISNSFTLTAPCTSSLASLAETSGENFNLASICTPTNPSLLPPTQTSPGVAQSTSQPNGTTVGATTQTFSWNAVSGASRYALYVRNLDTDVLEVNNENVTGTSFTSNVLKAGAKYKWNVRAIDSTGKGGWISDGLWFTVQSGVVETPMTGYIKLQVLDETNDPIVGVPIQTACYTISGTKCADQTQLQLLNPITDAKGLYLFSQSMFSSYHSLLTKVVVDGISKEALTTFAINSTVDVVLLVVRQAVSDIGVINGMLNGAYNLLEASYQVVMHPFPTVVNGVTGIYVALSDPSGTSNAVYEGLKGRYVEIVYVDINNYVSIYNSSKAFGQTTFDACTIGCTIGAGVVVKGTQLAKVSVDVSSTANKTTAIAKITKALKDANIARVVNQFGSATNIDDIANIAKNNRINATTESAYVIPGNKEAALQVAEKFGWSKVDNSNSNGTLITYTSPDELQRITYREFSTSGVPGYNLEATMDLLKNSNNDWTLLREVKFVTK